MMQAELEGARKEATRLSNDLFVEKSRLIEAQGSWTEVQRSLQSRVEQLSSQLERSKVQPPSDDSHSFEHYDLVDAIDVNVFLGVNNPAIITEY